MIRLSLLLMFFSSFGAGCNNNRQADDDPERIKDVDPESIWFDYQVTGEEGNDSVTVKLQYRYGEAGPTLELSEPATVSIDGKMFPYNTSKITGPYYEMQFPVKSFSGDHSITFTNINGKRYEQKFSFQPIALQTEVPSVIKRNTMIFQLNNISPGGIVRILMTDTAYASEGIERLDTIKNGQIIISEDELGKLANGPIHFELIRENERQIRKGTAAGGKIAVSYFLKREFILED
jgi:hypothetical protein